MAKATLPASQIALLISARHLDDETRSIVRAHVFTTAKAANGIPDDHKLSVEIDDTASPLYGVLIRKKTREAYDPALKIAQAATEALVAAAALAAMPAKRWFHVPIQQVSVGLAVENILDDCTFDQGMLDFGAEHHEISTSDDNHQVCLADNAVYVRLPANNF